MQLDWGNLPFAYLPTNCYIQTEFTKGAWGPLCTVAEPTCTVPVAATCLHYGQEIFEGLKAFRTKAGKVVLFRPEQNARRMQYSAMRLCMQAPPEELFLEACDLAIRKNLDYVPPYGTGAALYVRPLLLGTDPIIGVSPSLSYRFLVLVTPVGPYYQHGFAPVKGLIVDDYDRAAALGTGSAKAGGNYAASLLPLLRARSEGYSLCLYTHPTKRHLINEFGTSNFIAFDAAGMYYTPHAPECILASVTNASLQVLARAQGREVMVGDVELEDLARFVEVGAVGTAAVITPVHTLVHGDRVFRFGSTDKAGPICTGLIKSLQGIQSGDLEDRYGWMRTVVG